MINKTVNMAGLIFKNPVMCASGTFGSGMEYADFFDLNVLGAIVTKGVASIPWEGNAVPRIAETPAGMLNAIGLQNPGIDVFMERDLKFLEKTLQADSDGLRTRIIVNVVGKSIEDYVTVIEKLNETVADAYEINVSCPNVKEGGIAFGQDPSALMQITTAVKKAAHKPVIMKLSPNVTDITEMAKAAEAAGADAISLINTITGMKIDVYKKCFVIANRTGGLSGPAIRPVAVRMVWQCAQCVNIPIIGMGGITTAEDAVEFLLAGATGVAVGAAHFHDPLASCQVVKGIETYMNEQDITDISSLIGAVK